MDDDCMSRGSTPVRKVVIPLLHSWNWYSWFTGDLGRIWVFSILGFLLLLLYHADLLQRAHAYHIDKYRSAASLDDAPLPMSEVRQDGHTGLPNGSVHSYIQEISKVVPKPNLHTLGVLFLPRGLGAAFNILVLLNLISILISYALAGSEAYAQILGINFIYIIPVFVWVQALAIVFAQKFIHPVVSILTFFKGSVLVATVIVTFFVGSTVANVVTNDFAYFGTPFLMGTVALGGVFLVMPMMYAKVQYCQIQMKYFFYSITAGVATCAILNILWCWAVLQIVPQLSSCVLPSQMGPTNDSYDQSVTTLPSKSLLPDAAVCSQDYSLQRAAENGEISTVPLTEILAEDHPEFKWVAILIQVFIIISVTVSYLTLGSALKHSFLGWLDDLMSWGRHLTDERPSVTSRLRLLPRNVFRPILTLLLFGAIFGVAMANPKGFVTMLDKIASLLINLLAGLFVFLMVRKSRSATYRNLQIPYPVTDYLFPLHILLPIFFLFAVGYDIIISIIDFFH
ncbi:hypothetical protein BSL78_14503 [Apostichopus japonicus]|uniref:Amino acid transporter transmembrane domain-containing protein n=1 Tax=Stichopus japonicus TaxID=307972 RepID=A0A2G8KKU3_STIJA|nr:hypothetical protein BSL78_14503 [Apostichopus japonicus]